MQYHDLAGAILAGGRNLRMGGSEKAFIRLDGVTLIRRTVDLMRTIFPEVLLVTPRPDRFHHFENELTVVTDIFHGVGPLGGIHAGLSRTTKEAVFFVACDMPFLRAELIRRQVDFFQEVDCEVLLPRLRRRHEILIEPLHALYRRSLAGALERFLAGTESYAIRSFLASVKVQYLDLEDSAANRKIFYNLNTRRDLERIIPG